MGFFGGGGGAAASNMVGATSSAAGTAGLVPAPAAGEHNAVLGGQGAFLPALLRSKVTGWGGSRYFAPIGATNNNNGDGTITQNNASGRALLSPILLTSGSVNNLGVFVVSSPSSGTGYVALYNSTNDGLPNNLVASGSFTHTSAEANVAKTISISPSVSVKAGLYWGAVGSSVSNPQFRSAGRGNSLLSIFFGAEDGTGNFSTGGNSSSIYITTASAGAWPDPAGTFNYTNNGHPNVYVGFA